MIMDNKITSTFSNIGALAPAEKSDQTISPQQVITRLNFGRVDGETDNRFNTCFIGTETLRQVLLPQHSFVIGNKGSGKSAICRLLCEDLEKIRPLLPKEYKQIFCIPAYGLQSEENIPNVDLRELKPNSIDDFRYFWLLYLGLKLATTLTQDSRIKALVEKSANKELKATFTSIERLVADLGLIDEVGLSSKLKYIVERWKLPVRHAPSAQDNLDKQRGVDFKQRTGMSIIALLEHIDFILQETNCLAWLMLDKLDLLYVEDIEKLRAAITGLVQLLVQYGNQFKNIHFKIFLRNDIYRQLHIVNKSHLVSYTTEMKWRGSLLLKLLVARAIVDPHVREYCAQITGEKVDVSDVILGTDDYVRKIFYAIFEPTMNGSTIDETAPPSTHEWIFKHLIDGMGNSFPREIIHLGNKAVEIQREMNRNAGEHKSTRLISSKALKEAYHAVSAYRCETYLYSEFPHLKQHFDVFRGSDSVKFHREELYMLFQPLSPKGDEAIRAVYDAGVIIPMGKNVDSSREFKVPLLYRAGLGITSRRSRTQQPQHKESSEAKAIEIRNEN